MANHSQLYFIAEPAAASAVLDYFTANDAVVPNGSPAFQKGRNNHPLVIYPQAQVSFVDFHGVLPPDTEVIEVKLLWASTAFVGNAFWQVAWERDNPTFFVPQENLDVDNFAPPKSSLSSAPLISGLLREVSFTFTPAETGGVIPGEAYRLRVTRNALFMDTLAAEAQLFRVILGSA